MDPSLLESVNAGIIVTVLIALFSVFAAKKLRGKEEEHIVPPARATLPGIADFLMEKVYGMVSGVLAADTPKHFAFVGSLFLFILASNLFGMIPYAVAPTSSLATTIGLGLSVFFYFNIMGIRAHGLKGYIKHFFLDTGIPYVGFLITWFIAGLEVFSLLLRPGTLGFRLFKNLELDHQIVHTFQNLVAWVIPAPLLLLGLVVCIIQAFVFATLTAVYIQMSTEVHEHHEDAHHH